MKLKKWPRKKFDVILMDPPWSYYGQQDKWGAAAKFYQTMTDEEIFSLPIRSILNDPGVVFLWATGPRLDVAINALRMWGLYYRGVAFVWVKTKKDGVTPMGARGVRPSIVKPTSEFVLAGSTRQKGRPLPLYSEAVRQVIMAPVQEHSRKPEDVYRHIENLYPMSTKIELFARRVRRESWAVWGDEAGS